MGSLKVDVKWGKEVFKNIEIDANEPPLMFKNQLFSLTGECPIVTLEVLESTRDSVRGANALVSAMTHEKGSHSASRIAAVSYRTAWLWRLGGRLRKRLHALTSANAHRVCLQHPALE